MVLFSYEISALGYNTCQWVEDASLIVQTLLIRILQARDSNVYRDTIYYPERSFRGFLSPSLQRFCYFVTYNLGRFISNSASSLEYLTIYIYI